MYIYQEKRITKAAEKDVSPFAWVELKSLRDIPHPREVGGANFKKNLNYSTGSVGWSVTFEAYVVLNIPGSSSDLTPTFYQYISPGTISVHSLFPHPV